MYGVEKSGVEMSSKRNFSTPDFSTPDLSTLDFSTMNFPTPDFSTPDLGLKSPGLRNLGLKSSWLKSLGLKIPGLKSSWFKNLGLKGLGLKLGVEKSGVEMSFNPEYHVFTMRLLAKMLFPETGWVAFKELMDLVSLMMDSTWAEVPTKGSFGLVRHPKHSSSLRCNHFVSDARASLLQNGFLRQFFPVACLCHTSYNSFYKWNKISSLEIIIFELKNDGKKWSRIHFEIDRAPSELLLPSAKTSAQNGRIGQAA